MTGRFWLNPGNRGGGSSTDLRCATTVCPGSVPPQRVPDGHGSGPIGSRVSPKAHWLKSVSNGNEEVFSESFSYRKLLKKLVAVNRELALSGGTCRVWGR